MTKDFYNYFGITKSDVAKYTGEKEIVQYYKKYTGKSVQIDVVLKAVGVPSKYYGGWIKRKTLAAKNGIKAYVGLASQNTKLIALAKSGKLKKV